MIPNPLQSSSCDYCDPFLPGPGQDILDGILSGFYDGVGGSTIWAFIVVLSLGISLWSWSRGSAMPAIVLALLSGTVLNAAPGVVSSVGGVFMWVVGGIMLAIAFYRL